MPPPLNILWITCDEMRARSVSVYGNDLVQMPAAERLAREGATFDQTYVQMPKCVPSRCSMLTGRYPHTDGFRTLMGRVGTPPHPEVPRNDMVCLQEGDPNLVTALRAQGYRCGLLGKNHVVEWNLHRRWFEATPSWRYKQLPLQPATQPESGSALWRADYRGVVDAGAPELVDFEDAVTVREALDFMAAPDPRPFLALVDIGLPHPPYREFPDLPAGGLPLDTRLDQAFLPLDQAPEVEQCLRRSKDLESLSLEDRRRIHRTYLSMCEYADRRVQDLLDGLDQNGLAENTLVIFTADHGDFAGERNCFEKWDTSFYDSIVRVPLILRLPGRIPAGHRFPQLVELIDLAPTVLDFLGLDIPRDLHGRSLRPLLEGRTQHHRDAVFCQGGVERSLLRRPASPVGTAPVKQQVLLDYPRALGRARMVFDGRYKLIHRLDAAGELYDLEQDPEELRNRFEDPELREVRARLNERLVRFYMETETDRPHVSELHA